MNLRIGTATVTGTNAKNVEACARCYDPRSDVASNARVAPPRHQLSTQARKALAKLAARR